MKWGTHKVLTSYVIEIASCCSMKLMVTQWHNHVLLSLLLRTAWNHSLLIAYTYTASSTLENKNSSIPGNLWSCCAMLLCLRTTTKTATTKKRGKKSYRKKNLKTGKLKWIHLHVSTMPDCINRGLKASFSGESNQLKAGHCTRAFQTAVSHFW